MSSVIDIDVENIEIDLILEGLYRRYGYDFRNYARASLKRRLEHRLEEAGLKYFAEILPRLLHDDTFFKSLLQDLSVTVTEMFRDPEVFVAIREQIVPILKTYPFVKIWHAGCATGEEVYSMAILLKEEGFLDRAQIYATDFNKNSIKIAEEGIYPLKDMRKFSENYRAAGGKASLSDYYHAKYDSVIMDSELRKNMTFATHNLAIDHVFGEMNLILCRNVLIYFDKALQNRVLELFTESLCHKGILCIGTKESLEFTSVAKLYQAENKKQRLYRKQ